MSVVKGGVWTNVEDEILKAAVSKYGLNQWARVSSLLVRKTAKQCKARWTEWLDPGIRKTEWSQEEDEKLLHLVKLMPTQWRTIAPLVGRTATQCLERYQRLMDDLEAREAAGELGLRGPEGGETAAPTADDLRRLRPGQEDPDPESKPAVPDAIDMDPVELEMLSEARARLANTQGKKAKRKARERQLEESRRLAVLQKRRELKSAGINVKWSSRKKGEMDYNTDIPFEKAPAPGFYDTQEEIDRNEREKETFDPRKQQLANKRKGEEQEKPENKRRKDDSGKAAMANQLEKMREAERNTRRRPLQLPAPQVSEVELEDIIKMGMTGQIAEEGENGSTQGLVASYTNVVDPTPLRTPMVPKGQDRIVNELRNARARESMNSALLGGENVDLADEGTTGYAGAEPSKQVQATPNPLATPLRSGMTPGMTPGRTPRDALQLNQGQMQDTMRLGLRSKLAALPKPRSVEFELEPPEERAEEVQMELMQEDAAVRDRRKAAEAQALAMKEFRRQTQTVQRGLPRPSIIRVEELMEEAQAQEDAIERQVSEEAIRLMVHDAAKFGGAQVRGKVEAPRYFSEEALQRANMEVVLEMGGKGGYDLDWTKRDETSPTPEEASKALSQLQDEIRASAERCAVVEKRLAKLQGGYAARQQTLLRKIAAAAGKLDRKRLDVVVARETDIWEQAELAERLEKLRDEVAFVRKREREAQEEYRVVREELSVQS
ncbi:hypothetical protein K470DRAFT_257358 [Piedraia hortae CBS 480.64]|uniref:Cell division control protein n=1 Tax=Piedraia hortae CBS 480.64 TaxID=1314780 RepID=A0A6A7C255_9PEZI|nr:hypothetical protein K470DRAFT_257358 [Piedraia hortae CBS 480.64]